MDKQELEKQIETAIEAAGFELVDLRFGSLNGKPLLQVFADRAVGTITLDECGELSAKLGDLLDAGDSYPAGYYLEVSSPGMDRVIKKPRDFARYRGRNVKVKLRLPFNGGRVHYGGIAGLEQDTLALSGGEKFKLADIEEVRLHPTDEEMFRGK